MFPSKLLWSIT